MASKYTGATNKFVEWVDYTPADVLEVLKREDLERTDLIAIIQEMCHRLAKMAHDADRGMGHGVISG